MLHIGVVPGRRCVARHQDIAAEASCLAADRGGAVGDRESSICQDSWGAVAETRQMYPNAW